MGRTVTHQFLMGAWTLTAMSSVRVSDGSETVDLCKIASCIFKRWMFNGLGFTLSSPALAVQWPLAHHGKLKQRYFIQCTRLRIEKVDPIYTAKIALC